MTIANGATPAEAATAAAKVAALEAKYDLGRKPAEKATRPAYGGPTMRSDRAEPRAAQRTAASTPPPAPPKRSRVAGMFWAVVALMLGVSMTPVLPGVIMPIVEASGWMSKEALDARMAAMSQTLRTIQLPWSLIEPCDSGVGQSVGVNHQGVPIRLRPAGCADGVPTGVFHRGTEIKLRP